MYYVLLVVIAFLTGSGVIGSDAFLIGITLGGILCVIGFSLMFKDENNGEDKK